jgi:imidazolonepropionase-like amidohydrolase
MIKTGDSPRKDPRWQLLRADEQARWERILAGPVAQDQAREQLRLDVARRIVSAMHRAGVSIVAGTDSPMPNVYPGFSLHEELALLVESGLSPHEALRSATLTSAEFLGIAADGGSVVVGKRADLVLLDADPIKDIRNTRRINAVVFDGRLLQRADLDELLEPLLPAR